MCWKESKPNEFTKILYMFFLIISQLILIRIPLSPPRREQEEEGKDWEVDLGFCMVNSKSLLLLPINIIIIIIIIIIKYW